MGIRLPGGDHDGLLHRGERNNRAGKLWRYRKNTECRKLRGECLGSGRVIRGGGWGSAAAAVRSAYRYYNTPSGRDGSLGFRLLRPHGYCCFTIIF
jgi:formylglycine-generating enzyme required for sulfatase activity